MAQIVFKIALLCKLIALVTSAAIRDESLAKIIKNEYSIDEKGNYVFRFQTSNGLERYEKGNVVNYGEPNEHIQVVGIYSYYNDEDMLIIFKYTADEEGYQQKLEKPLLALTSIAGGVPSVIIASIVG